MSMSLKKTPNLEPLSGALRRARPSKTARFKVPHVLTKGLVSVLLVALLVQTANAASAAPQQSSLYYRVFLNAQEIGFHQVEFEQQTDGLKVSINAEFNVKFLIFNAYSYVHSAQEIWSDGCLQSLQADTLENRDKLFVRTKQTSAGLDVTSHKTEASLTGCIASFAYWDKRRLQADNLLNSESGEYVPAALSEVGMTEFSIGGTTTRAEQIRLTAEDAEINLWYGPDQQWLALETIVKGRKLAYVRADKPTQITTQP